MNKKLNDTNKAKKLLEKYLLLLIILINFTILYPNYIYGPLVFTVNRKKFQVFLAFSKSYLETWYISKMLYLFFGARVHTYITSVYGKGVRGLDRRGEVEEKDTRTKRVQEFDPRRSRWDAILFIVLIISEYIVRTRQDAPRHQIREIYASEVNPLHPPPPPVSLPIPSSFTSFILLSNLFL